LGDEECGFIEVVILGVVLAGVLEERSRREVASGVDEVVGAAFGAGVESCDVGINGSAIVEVE